MNHNVPLSLHFSQNFPARNFTKSKGQCCQLWKLLQISTSKVPTHIFTAKCKFKNNAKSIRYYRVGNTDKGYPENRQLLLSYNNWMKNTKTPLTFYETPNRNLKMVLPCAETSLSCSFNKRLYCAVFWLISHGVSPSGQDLWEKHLNWHCTCSQQNTVDESVGFEIEFF